MWWVLVLKQLLFPIHESEKHVGGDRSEDAPNGHVEGEGRKVNRAVTLQNGYIFVAIF